MALGGSACQPISSRFGQGADAQLLMTRRLEPFQRAQQGGRGAAGMQLHRVNGFPILVHGPDVDGGLARAAHQDDGVLAVRVAERAALELARLALPAVGGGLAQLLHRGEVIVAAGQGEVLLVLGGEDHALPDLAHLGQAEGRQAEENGHRQRGADQLEDAAVVGFQPDAHHRRGRAALRNGPGCHGRAAHRDRHLDHAPLERPHRAALVFQLPVQADNQDRVVDARHFTDQPPRDPDLRAALAIDHQDLRPCGLPEEPLVVLDVDNRRIEREWPGGQMVERGGMGGEAMTLLNSSVPTCAPPGAAAH